MGYCGTKIHGHSGTQFKHRKAFSKIKSLRDSTTYSKNKVYNPDRPKTLFKLQDEIDHDNSSLILKLSILCILTVLVIVGAHIFYSDMKQESPLNWQEIMTLKENNKIQELMRNKIKLK